MARFLVVGIAVWILTLGGQAAPGPQVSAPESIVLILQGEFVSIEDVEGRLSRLEQALLASGDGRAVFATVYRMMTEAIAEHAEAGFFLDSDWSADLAVTFADFYRRAFLDYELGRLKSVPEAWRVAFDVAASKEGNVLRNAILGVNAHVNHDLALAVYALGMDPDRSTHCVDFGLVNIVLHRATDGIEDALAETYDPRLADLDAALGRLDEALANQMLGQWRGRAWRVAAVLTRVSNEEVERAVLDWLDDSAGRLSRVFAGPRLD